MFKDSTTGKPCTAKTLYVLSWLVVMLKIIISGVAFGDWTGETVDFIGLAAVLTVTSGIYYGRSKVKADNKSGDIQTIKSSN